jgi:hypothetical protein
VATRERFKLRRFYPARDLTGLGPPRKFRSRKTPRLSARHKEKDPEEESQFRRPELRGELPCPPDGLAPEEEDGREEGADREDCPEDEA